MKTIQGLNVIQCLGTTGTERYLNLEWLKIAWDESSKQGFPLATQRLVTSVDTMYASTDVTYLCEILFNLSVWR